MYKFKTSLFVTDHLDSIEDHLDLLQQLQISNHIEVATGAANSKKCLSRYANKESTAAPELIFLHFSNPLKDGLLFLKHFSSFNFSNAEQVRMIVVTSEANHEESQSFSMLGNFEFISTPIKPESLIELLSVVLQN